MNSVNPSTLRDVCIILLSLVGVVCLIINTINSNRRKPSADADLAALGAKLENLKAELKAKQSTTVCNAIIERMDGHFVQIRDEMKAITQRHAVNEAAASTKLGGVHRRIDDVLTAISILSGKYEEHSKGTKQ